MARLVVLGAGMVGSVMAWDLCRIGHDVTVVDARDEALERMRALADVSVMRADLASAAAVTETVKPFDVVVGALSSRLGLATLRAVILAKKKYVDISFMAENALELDAFAKEHGATAIVDMGVTPGMSNVIAGKIVADMTSCERLEVLVGGLPVVRSWPWEYKAPFAPSDVIEEYVRPARVVENGKIVVKEALSEPELVDFAGVGTLEAFATDGLRSLAYTLDVPFMRERTLRYPGHIALAKVLRETGFFSPEPIDVGGQKVSPLEVTSKLLFPKWSFADREEDLTVMRLVAEGTRDGRRERHVWELHDRFDPATGFRSMSRTTGFPATVCADLVARGMFDTPGVHAPEALGRVPGLLEHFRRELAARGVVYTDRVEAI